MEYWTNIMDKTIIFIWAAFIVIAIFAFESGKKKQIIAQLDSLNGRG